MKIVWSNFAVSMLKEIYDYDEDGDYFTNLTSKYLPIESDFIKFWEKTINITSDNIDSFDELEIDELFTT